METPSPFPTIHQKARPAHRKACSRCRKRRIRCDKDLPSCQACRHAETPCVNDDDDGVARSHSLITHLEQEVAALEKELTTLESEATSSSSPWQDRQSLPLQQANFTRAVASAVADAPMPLWNSDAMEQLTVRLTFHLQPSHPPQPVHDGNARGLTSKKPLAVRSLPSMAAELLYKNYTEIHLPQYPCVSEIDLARAFQRCRGDGSEKDSVSVPDFDTFIVSMAMAISANTLLWKDESNALAASAGFWAAAKILLDLPEVIQNETQHLQYCLLMVHYGFTNPAVVDVWSCIGDAVRLCLQLGYHRDTVYVSEELSPLEVDSRRRLFWTTCAMEWAICHYVRLPPVLNHNEITAKLPSPLSDDAIARGVSQGPRKKAAGWHMLQIRILEMEALRVLYHREPIVSFEHWSADIMLRIEQYYQESLGYVTEHKLEFRNIQYHGLRGRIHKPTPLVPQPSESSRLICIASAQAIVEDYSRQKDQGRLFYPWHAGYVLFETAVYLIDTAWNCHDWLRDIGKAEEVAECMMKFPLTIRRVSTFWPALEACADSLDELIPAVLMRLKVPVPMAAVGLGCLHDDDDASVSARIAQYLFPATESSAVPRVQGGGASDSFDFDFNDLDWGNDGQFDFLEADSILMSLLSTDSLAPGLSGPEL